MKRYAELLKPVRIANLEIDNRVAVIADDQRLADADGNVSNELIRSRMTQAKSGAGLIITEPFIVDFGEQAAPDNGSSDLLIDSDEYLPNLQRLTSAIHAAGASVIIRLGLSNVLYGAPILRGVAQNESNPALDVVNGEYERLRIIACFRAAAGRVAKTGADGIELDGALACNLRSPALQRMINGRSVSGADAFNDFFEVVNEMRRAFPTGRPIICRIDLNSFIILNDGFEDLINLAETLKTNGQFDALHLISDPLMSSNYQLKNWSEAVRASAGLPIISTVGVNSLDEADALIASGSADICGFRNALPKQGVIRRPRSSVYLWSAGRRRE